MTSHPALKIVKLSNTIRLRVWAFRRSCVESEAIHTHTRVHIHTAIHYMYACTKTYLHTYISQPIWISIYPHESARAGAVVEAYVEEADAREGIHCSLWFCVFLPDGITTSSSNGCQHYRATRVLVTMRFSKPFFARSEISTQKLSAKAVARTVVL